jgi:mannose-1-phosphate guanylyltransferase
LVTARPLLEDAYRRAAPLVPPAHMYVMAEEQLLLVARPMLPEVPLSNFIAEPAARNTWPCCLLGTLVIAARLGPDATVLALPADHAVGDDDVFRAALRAGLDRAAAGAIVTFGVKPTRPETGYGYIKCGEGVAAGPPRVRRGLAFREKPDAATAAAYATSGDYLWNSGMFVWRADRFLEAVRDAAPAAFVTAERMRKPLAAGEAAEVEALYGELEATSVDYALMEKIPAFEVVETACAWDDIGSFEALERVLVADGRGNVARGETYVIDGGGNVVVSGGRRAVVALGMEGVVVVDAGDVVLVYPKGQGEEVRRAVALMRERRPDLL